MDRLKRTNELLQRHLGAEAGQRRTAALLDTLEYYTPPALRDRLNFLGEMTPTNDIHVSMGAARDGDYAKSAVNALTAAAPALAVPFMRGGGRAAAETLEDVLMGVSVKARGAGDAAREFALSEDGALFPNSASVDEALEFANSGDGIFHSGHAPDVEDMHNWGVEPQHGPWVREVLSGAVDDVDQHLDGAPMAAWWSDAPTWIKSKVSRAVGKPQSDLTVEDIRKHGHLAIASADDYADDAFKVGPDGLMDGERTTLQTLGGDDVKLYETPLYEFDDNMGVGRYPEGVEVNEIITGTAIEPRYSLTGDELVEFMRKRGELPDPAPQLNPAQAEAENVLRLWHGSPHDFDRFDSRRMGSGEGAQAYGHGLYFAENPDVAAEYQRSIARNSDELERIANSSGVDGDAAKMLAYQFSMDDFHGQGFNTWMDGLKDGVEKGWHESDTPTNRAIKRIIDREVEASAAVADMKRPGSAYEVAMDANAEDFIDFDAPWEEQPEAVKRHFAHLARGDSKPDGMDLARRIESPTFAREASDAGIKGIRYLDQGSRNAGNGTRNYVAFNDRDLQILSKNGERTPQGEAQNVLDLLRAGNADQVTDDMLAAADDAYLFNNYDLPMDYEARMARKAEMVDPTNLYHGTYSNDEYQSLRPSNQGKVGPGVYLTPEVKKANNFSGADEPFIVENHNPRVFPVLATNNPADDAARTAAWHAARDENGRYLDDAVTPVREVYDDRGFDGVSVEDERTILNPSNIRSRFARFDPRLKHLTNLSAGVGGVGLLSLLASQPDNSGAILEFLGDQRNGT